MAIMLESYTHLYTSLANSVHFSPISNSFLLYTLKKARDWNTDNKREVKTVLTGIHPMVSWFDSIEPRPRTLRFIWITTQGNARSRAGGYYCLRAVYTKRTLGDKKTSSLLLLLLLHLIYIYLPRVPNPLDSFMPPNRFIWFIDETARRSSPLTQPPQRGHGLQTPSLSSDTQTAGFKLSLLLPMSIYAFS